MVILLVKSEDKILLHYQDGLLFYEARPYHHASGTFPSVCKRTSLR